MLCVVLESIVTVLQNVVFPTGVKGVKSPNWREAEQLAIYKHDQGVELESTENLNISSLAVRAGETWTPNHSAATLPPCCIKRNKILPTRRNVFTFTTLAV